MMKSMISEIYSYTREQAIGDGVLIDVSDVASEAGFKYPVAVTSSVWDRYVEVPHGLEGLQDEAGRLWDVLCMLMYAIRSGNNGANVTYRLLVQEEADKAPQLVTLKALCGPGDNAEPVITVMLPEED